MLGVRTATFLAALGSAALPSTSAVSQDMALASERLFRARCGSCHSMDVGANRIGPHLASIVGRRAGTVEGARYSRALQASTIVWDERTLDGFLANPRQAVPGTTMTVNLPNAADRASVIQYLAGGSTRAKR